MIWPIFRRYNNRITPVTYRITVPLLWSRPLPHFYGIFHKIEINSNKLWLKRRSFKGKKKRNLTVEHLKNCILGGTPYDRFSESSQELSSWWGSWRPWWSLIDPQQIRPEAVTISAKLKWMKKYEKNRIEKFLSFTPKINNYLVFFFLFFDTFASFNFLSRKPKW